MANRIGFCAVVSSAMLVVAACDSGRPENSATPGESANGAVAQQTAAADPCAFISKDEVTAITEEAIVETEADGDTCKYQTDDPASSLEVEVHPTGGAEEMDIARTATGTLGEIGADLKNKGGAEGDTGELLTESGAAPAIGDQAFFGANQQLHVLKGDAHFSVLPPIMKSRMGGGNPMLPAEKKREIAAAIARKIETKL